MNQTTPTGPLGFPLTDRQAFALETILQALPKSEEFKYRKTVIAKGASEVMTGERSDVSWITTEDPDRGHEVVVARGMNDSQYKLNPIVTMQHAYYLPPVGKSLWRKVVKDGALRGIKAKTQYPSKPADWQGNWPSDVAFSLIQSDLLRGKSIGFLPTKVHTPTDRERDQAGWRDVNLVIDEWILLEYACCFLPCQQNAVVEAVSKSAIAPLPDDFLQAMGLSPDLFRAPTPTAPTIPFTPLEEIEKSIQRRINALDFSALANQAIQDGLDRVRGRV